MLLIIECVPAPSSRICSRHFEEYLKNSETKTCDLIEKKKLGALVKPHPDIETIVNVTDCILSQKIKGTMFFGYLNFLFSNI